MPTSSSAVCQLGGHGNSREGVSAWVPGKISTQHRGVVVRAGLKTSSSLFEQELWYQHTEEWLQGSRDVQAGIQDLGHVASKR